ncbi:MAG: serine hydrolase, partial [Calditrichaeota bacterium]|nr:serine hydrolase [Calditrichota bacterium]
TAYRTFAELYLFAPLGITDYQCEMLTYQVAFASGGLYLRPRDMAKFGQLYLQHGVWNDEPVISPEWVEASTRETIAVPASENFFPGIISGYGYQWWLGTFPRGNTPFYFAAGWGGQYIVVFPSLEMVVVITGGSYETGDGGMFYRMVNDYILPAAL